jgi:hypothetical protein
VLDGEVVALGPDGRPDFQQLQQRMRRRPPGTPVVYMVFDVLWLDGRSVFGLPLAERRVLLEVLGLAGPSWQTTTLFAGQAAELLGASRQQGLEGIMVKRLHSPYRLGRRSADWAIELLSFSAHRGLTVLGAVPRPFDSATDRRFPGAHQLWEVDLRSTPITKLPITRDSG